MDAHLDPSDILNLFTGAHTHTHTHTHSLTVYQSTSFLLPDLADKNAIDCSVTINLAQATIAELQGAITKN